MTGPCAARDQPLATSLSELFWLLVSAQAPDPGLYGDKAHPAKTDEPPFSPGNLAEKTRVSSLCLEFGETLVNNPIKPT